MPKWCALSPEQMWSTCTYSAVRHAITPAELATVGTTVGETLACVLSDSIQLFFFPRDVTHFLLAPQWFPNHPYLLSLFSATAY